MRVTRLRQAVVIAHDRDAVLAEWQTQFGLGGAFHDPGVGEFGLHNWVVPVGDTFLEVVSPIEHNTTAGRYLERAGGDAGYMVIFQVEDIAEARAHLASEHCRTVWNGDFPSISGTHLHPADVGGAIVSVDQPNPPSSWMWGGANWQAHIQTSIVNGLAGITLADPDPSALASRWARLLNLEVVDGVATLPDQSTVRFVPTDARGHNGLVGIDLRASNASERGRTSVVANVAFTLV